MRVLMWMWDKGRVACLLVRVNVDVAENWRESLCIFLCGNDGSF